MPISEQYFRRVMSGSERSLAASCLRGAAAIAEPIYAGIMGVRNSLYDRQIRKSHSLGKPTISVGNITTGGTGKTPVVRWLAGQLRAAGHTPAVLMRGYKSVANQSDEQMELAADGILAIANPDRIRGSADAIAQQSLTDVFILDDGMQHRRAARDFEIVLIHAGEPFGFGHVFPRGLLREPLSGLRRAAAILITHAGEVSPDTLEHIKTVVSSQTSTPIYVSEHVINRFQDSNTNEISLEVIRAFRFFAFCGIGSPDGFFNQIRNMAGTLVGSKPYNDHHHYTIADLSRLRESARATNAQMLVTTEKDWAKIVRLPVAIGLAPPIIRAQLSLRFWQDHETRLLEQIRQTITSSRQSL